MRYLKKTWSNNNSDCKILIYDRREDFSELVIQIQVLKYDLNHNISKSFNNSIILPIEELSNFSGIVNIVFVIDDLLKDIFNSKVKVVNGTYRYHIVDNCIYARKYFTKFIVCSNESQIKLIKNAIIKYYNKRR